MTAMPVLVIGRDPVWRARMQRMLALRAELEWLGAYQPAQPRRAASHPAALLLLDGDDPEVERERRRPRLPAPRRLYFFRHPTLACLQRCIDGGAHACLNKQAEPERVLHAIRAAEAGLFVTHPELLRAALRIPVVALPAEPPGDWSLLTGRQREIVRWAARGLSNKQIARQLGISPETVKTHLHHIFEREGVHGRVALLAAARRLTETDAVHGTAAQ
ncbi:response regulator transcription factor [Vulcaniibacterium gelatinicum]|uniref:response regulator transcription factor n=1 Tax=Vulcaniibacterium gelatinicum TaxID=2598725 RepID=UPI0011CC05CC|nr:response regulator transcription factor [Vulcaniibacterium gelatinicum]